MPKIIQHTNILGESLLHLYQSGKYSDVALVVVQKRIPVHRIILAQQSEFFERLFYDNQFNESDKRDIPINAPLDGLECILQYIYSGCMDLQEKNYEDILEILELSRRYGLLPLESTLIDELCPLVTIMNIRQLVNVADLLNSDKLMRKCFEVLHGDLEKFVVSTDFMNSGVDEVLRIFSSKYFEVTNIVKFQWIANWIFINDCDDAGKEKLLSIVDFTKLTDDQLIRVVRPTKMLKTEVIINLLDSRETEVKEEVIKSKPRCSAFEPSHYSIHNVRRNVQPSVIFGSLTEEMIVAEKVNKEYELIIDLGKILVIDYIHLNLNVEKLCNYSVLISSRDPFLYPWRSIVFNIACSRQQKILVTGETCRYLKFKGILSCNLFKAVELYSNKKPTSISFDQDMLLPSTAYIVDRPDDQLLQREFKNGGLSTPYSTITSEGIIIRFNQPTILRRFRARLWDFDGRQQYFRIELITAKVGLERVVKLCNSGDGWILDELPEKYYVELRIIPSRQQEELRLVSIEASAAVLQ